MRKATLLLVIASLLLVFAACSDKDKAEVVDDVEEESETVVEVDKKVSSADYTVKIQRVKVEDDLLKVVFDWENQSEWDPAHFELLGTVSVLQNGDYLEEVSDERKYKQIKKGRFDVYDLEYKLQDDSDITIRIKTNNEDDSSEEEFDVKIK